MLDIKFIRENPDSVKTGAKNKGVAVDTDKLLRLDQARAELQRTLQLLQEKRNVLTKSIAGKPTPEQIEEGKKMREELDKAEGEFHAINDELNTLLLSIPNLPKPDVKVGKDDTENDVIKTWGEPKKFDFTPQDHLALGEALGMIDMERAAKVSGARFAYRKGDGVLLELALTHYAFDFLVKEGFTPVIPPVLIKRDVMKGLGYMENGGEEDMFALKDNDMFLVGTAEQTLVPMHKDEILDSKNLPLRYVGFSASFRREAGSYGKDTRGIFRNHQFNKVEMVSFVKEGEDDKEQEYLLSLEEKLFQSLDIPYQVIKMCTGDLGFPAARKYDIEAWIPSQNKYREVTSVSTVTDFQSRRLNMKYQDGAEKKYLQVLNGTAFAMSRTPIAIIENYQQEDGSVVVPEALRNYMGKDVIKTPK
jgi:seryl-tRNA synthetase